MNILKVQPVAVYVQDLELSEKSKNALLRCGIRTLNELVLRRNMEISCIRGLGDSGVKEVQALLARSESVFAEFEERAQRIQQIYPEVCGISIMELPVETRTRNILQRLDIHNLSDLIRLSGKDIAELPSIGPETRSQLEMLINGIIENGKSCIANWKTAKSAVQRETLQKGFDFPLIDRLASEYFLKSANLADWFGLSRQRIHQIMKERPAKRTDCWTGKSLSGEEKSVLAKLVEAKTFESQSQNAKCACFNNKCNDFACIFVCEQEIKAFFLKELPDDLQIQIRAARMHQLSAAELNDLKQGTFVSILKQPHFVPKNSADFRENANLRGFSEDEYSRFLSGFPYASPKAITDEEIVRFLRGKLTEGRVYLPSDSGSRWVRAFAAQHHMGIRELVEFYGYKACLTSRELADVRTRRKHIEELTPHIVRGNVVYFPIESAVYRNLNAYAGQKHIPLNQYVESLGFTRTFERSAMAQDDLEADMRSYGDEDIFASCPLLGNRILDAGTLDNLNFSARKLIDTVLERPSIKLSFESKKEIALALINHAKHWDGASKTDFWTYLALQFGFRDKDGAVVEIFQEAFQKALEQSGRLFVTDRNGRAFKTTILIHAFGPKRSWMALYDLLFNFYKDNLHWRYSPEEPLLGSMIEALERKLGNADIGKDAMLQIRFSTYRFQEGICKLILLRPRYTRHLFEHMLWKIDALVRMKNHRTETYVDVLADEWFQSKFLSASSTGRLKKQMPEIAAVAAEYSRVRIRYILRNRNEICLSIPDVRLKSVDFERITVSICVNSVPAQQIELGWYGDELGKTMQGQIIPLLTGLERVSVQISCDNDLIYDSGSSLFREMFIFAGEREIKKTAIQKGCYTFVLPESDALFCEKARIKEVEGFRCTGFRAYFADLQAGYILRAGEKRIAFDKEDGHFRAVLPPESLILPSLTIEQEELLLAKTGSVLTVLLNKATEISKYQFYRNNRRVRVSPAEENGCLEIMLECPLAGDRLSECRIQVIDIARNRTLFDKRFLLVSDANIEFNREFYYSQPDYQDASVTLQIDVFLKRLLFQREKTSCLSPFGAGCFKSQFPGFKCRKVRGFG